MSEIIIRLPGKPEKVGRLSEGIYRIGSSPAAHIQLSLPEISSRHALLTVRGSEVTLEDAGSTNGTFLDSKRVGSSPVPVPSGSVIRIGTAEIVIRQRSESPSPAPPPASPGGGLALSPPGAGSSLSPPVPAHVRVAGHAPQILQFSGIRADLRQASQLLKAQVHDELLKRMNLKNLTLSGANPEEVSNQARTTIQGILTEFAARVPRGVEVKVIERELLNEAIGLGCIEFLLADSEVTEVMVNGHDHVFVEKRGVLYRTDLMFASDMQLLTVIERIVAPLGRRIDESQPLVDARLADGSRVNAIIPPLAIDGPTLTIRKFSKSPMTMEILVRDKQSLSPDMSEFLRLSVMVRKNILISGGTGSGKTTLLNAVSNFIPNNERIVTIEDAAELRLMKEHVVRLEARPPNIEGRGEITIRDLVKNSLRMRPDRIVVGECRGGEALDMLQAMNTGHDGSLTTVHANASRDALARLETLVLMSGFDLPLRAIREQISSAVNIIVQISRMRDGTRRVVEIAEVTGMEGEVITTQELFRFDNQGLGPEGQVLGKHVSCGIVPTFLEEIQVAGLSFDMGMFNREP